MGTGVFRHAFKNPTAKRIELTGTLSRVEVDTSTVVVEGDISFISIAPTAGSPADEVAFGNLTLSEPAGAQKDDLLVAIISFRGTAAFTPPAGWSTAVSTAVGNTTIGTTASLSGGIMAYIVRGASAPSYLFTRTGGDLAMGRVVCYRGCDVNSPFDLATSIQLASASATVSMATITLAGYKEMLVMGACMARTGNSASGYNATTDPTPTAYWHERCDSASTLGADGALAIADSTKLSPTSGTGTLTYTASSSARHVNLVGAFKSASTPINITRVAIATPRLTTSTAALTTPSFTPPNNCLLVAVAANRRSGGAHTGVVFTNSGTALTWTIRKTATGDNATIFGQLDIATAPISGSHAAMTVSVDQTTDNIGVMLHVFAVTGAHPNTPIRATGLVNNLVGDDTGTLQLAPIPEWLSLAIQARMMATSTTGLITTQTPGAGWNELSDTSATTTNVTLMLGSQGRFLSNSPTCSYLDLDDVNIAELMASTAAVEVKAVTNITVQAVKIIQRNSNNNATALTTTNFFPPNNSLLVAVANTQRDGGANTGITFSDSTGLTWTIRQTATGTQSTFFGSLDIATAQVGATAASMTVSVDATTDTDTVMLQVFVITGHDPLSPIGATGATNSPIDVTTGRVTLSAAPRLTSAVLHARTLNWSGTTIPGGPPNPWNQATPGAAWWELTDDVIQAWQALAVQERIGSTSDLCDFTDIDVTAVAETFSMAVAIEIKSSGASLASIVPFPKPLRFLGRRM